MKETKYRQVKITVANNGYVLSFSDYEGVYSGKDFKVSKSLNDVLILLTSNLVDVEK